MKIDEIKQLGLDYQDKITIVAWIPPSIADVHKATFITIKQPDKRSQKYDIFVKLYRCQNVTLIDIDDITSIEKGWE